MACGKCDLVVIACDEVQTRDSEFVVVVVGLVNHAGAPEGLVLVEGLAMGRTARDLRESLAMCVEARVMSFARLARVLCCGMRLEIGPESQLIGQPGCFQRSYRG